MARPEHGVTSALVSRAILGEPELLAAAREAPELPVELREWMATSGRPSRRAAVSWACAG